MTSASTLVNKKVAAPNPDTLRKDHRHGVFNHRKGYGAEKQHDKEAGKADHPAMLKKYPHLFSQSCCISRVSPFPDMLSGCESTVPLL
jgi:hypothetical protein